MPTTVALREREERELETIRFITNALFEVSAENITHLRAEFEKNHLFYIDVSDLYRTVKRAARARGHLGATSPTLVRGVSVAFTSNSRFYGSINTDIMRTFLDHMRVTKRDCIVIGNTGDLFMQGYDERKRCQFFLFKDDQPTEKEMRRFLKQVSAYDQVHVFYPSFVNIFTQEVAVLDITHTPQAEDENAEEENLDYIFEPELPKILRFFEHRVRYLLFKRIMLESALARTAARLMAMNRAEGRAEEALRKVRTAVRREREMFDDMRLLESFAGIARWKK